MDNFKRPCREKRFAARDFVYSAQGYTKFIETRQRLEQEVQSQTAVITGIYRDAWSDVMHGLVHVKAMRIFVESVMRYGMPAKFASFYVAIITPMVHYCMGVFEIYRYVDWTITVPLQMIKVNLIFNLKAAAGLLTGFNIFTICIYFITCCDSASRVVAPMHGKRCDQCPS